MVLNFVRNICIILVNTLLPVTAQNKEAGNSKKEYIRISLEKRIPYESGKADYIIVNEIQEWIPGKSGGNGSFYE